MLNAMITIIISYPLLFLLEIVAIFYFNGLAQYLQNLDIKSFTFACFIFGGIPLVGSIMLGVRSYKKTKKLEVIENASAEDVLKDPFQRVDNVYRAAVLVKAAGVGLLEAGIFYAMMWVLWLFFHFTDAAFTEAQQRSYDTGLTVIGVTSVLILVFRILQGINKFRKL